MSVESGTNARSSEPAITACALCGGSFDRDDDLVVQCYPEADGALPERAATDGFLGVCPDCAVEVDDLIGAWDAHGEPPVGPDASIAAGYRQATDACSFCDRGLGEDPLLGVEYVRGIGDDRDEADAESSEYANYALCAGCVPVFDEFLRGVGGDPTA